jgi:hypothetical protein
VKYSVDRKTNRLRITSRTGAVCPDGEFRVNASNNLAYWLNEPLFWRRQHGLPGKIAFNGAMRLTPHNDLELTLRSGDRLALRGRIIGARGDELAFQVASEDKRGTQHVRLLKFSGAWGADDANRIYFSVRKRTLPDILTLSGGWVVNDNQQIVYSFEKTDRVTGERVVTSLGFAGYWRITRENRLSYIFSRGSDSRFDFKAHLETPNMYPQKGVIKYRIGGGIRQGKRDQPVIVCLYGRWNFSRKTGLSFEMDYGKGQVHSMRFGAGVNVSKKDTIELDLVNEEGETLGGSLICTHRFLRARDGAFFVRLKKIGKEQSIDAGVTIPF